MQKNW